LSGNLSNEADNIDAELTDFKNRPYQIVRQGDGGFKLICTEDCKLKDIRNSTIT
jgi:hypothetical protein